MSEKVREVGYTKCKKNAHSGFPPYFIVTYILFSVHILLSNPAGWFIFVTSCFNRFTYIKAHVLFFVPLY